MRRGLAALTFIALSAAAASAQLAPNADWHTIATLHFRVHFTPELEAEARRTAANAEIAYAQLSRELTPPRGVIDVVLSDDVDFTNGYANQFPTNRIVLYANPPVNETALRFTDDPDALVITHELTHIFHLDRSRGIWDLGQHVFGRAPFLFPDAYSPSWLLEGLAVYYETRLTGTGRVTGSDHRMIAHAAALEHRFPSIDEISLATVRFPYGLSTYVYGSLFMDYMSRTYGDAHVRDFVEAQSENLIPLWLNRPAREAFGISFSSAWRQWRDSLTNAASDPSLPVPGWRFLTEGGDAANFVRWVDDTALTYSGSTGRESYGAFSVSLDGQIERLGRRNSDSPTLIQSDGERIFSQLEYVDAYHVRSDLFVEHGGSTSRLTEGARLSVPDLRADGLIVAVQTIPAGTRLVLLAHDGTGERPLTGGGPDEQWTEPRWSPDGHYIAAAHWLRGGISEIVVIDTSGTIVQRIAPAHAIQAAPSWSPDGQRILFTSDRTGITNVYSARFTLSGDDDLQRITSVATGIFYPQISPDGRWLAGSVVLADGYHVGIVPLERATPRAAEPLPAAAEPHDEPPPASVDSPATTYSPWSMLWPRYWMPVTEPSIAGGARIGAYTSGSDIVGRHAYDAQLFVPTDRTGVTGNADYAYAGLGMPVVLASGQLDWANEGTILDDHHNSIGTLRERSLDGSLGLVFTRQRYRTFSSFSLSTGLERDNFATDPASGLARIDSTFLRAFYYPSVVASATWSNVQSPTTSISFEDGVTVGGVAEERFATGGAPGNTFNAVAAASAYKSLDFPGFAHQVLALRGAAGYADNNSTSYLEVGGVSGSTLTIVPGVAIGGTERNFPVRGFQPGTLVGLQAYSGSAEYRVPLALLDRGWSLLPFFVDRGSISLFYDFGTAWCPRVLAPGALCTDPRLTQRTAIASAGAELNFTAAMLQWDTPYRFRVGFALPSLGRSLFGPSGVAGYFALGLYF